MSAEAEAVVRRAWEGLDPARVIDAHVHVVGLGVGGTGAWVNPHMRSWLHPAERARFEIYLRAAGIDDLDRADAAYAERLTRLADTTPHGRFVLLAFDRAHTEDGSVELEASEFYVPNDYVLSLARANPALFIACASIHPYREDAVSELERVAALGARCVKWLPSAMRIDPASPRCDAFYDKLAALGVPLLSHGGEERAVDVKEAQALSNPLRLRRALDRGVKVIVAHAASSGQDLDLDARGADKPLRPSIELFFRMLEEPRYERLLFGELSATTQYNRCHVLPQLLARPELATRFVNGSDYPLPAIHALLRTKKLVELGLITALERESLNEIDAHNPLLFDFVVKRTLRGPGGAKLPDAVFMPPEGLYSGG